MNCQEIQEKLLAHRVGELDAAAAAALHQHLETCAACRAAAEETERVLDLMRSAFAAGPAAPAQLDKPHRNRVLRAQFTWAGYRNIILEVAAVIFVCVVLGSLLLPATSSALSKAKMTQALHELKLAEVQQAELEGSVARASNPNQVKDAQKKLGSSQREEVYRFTDDGAAHAPAEMPTSASTATRSLQRSERRDGEDKGNAPAAVAVFEPAARSSSLARSGRDEERKVAASAPADALKNLAAKSTLEFDWSDRGGLAQNMDFTPPLPPAMTAPPAKQPAAGEVARFSRGNGMITKSGSGTLTFDGANTYSGGTTINAGTMVMNATARTDARAAGNSSVAANTLVTAEQLGIVNNATFSGMVQPNDASGRVVGSGGVGGGGGVAVSDLNGTALNLGGTVVSAGKAAIHGAYVAQNVAGADGTLGKLAPAAGPAGGAAAPFSWNDNYYHVKPTAPAADPEGRRNATATDTQRMKEADAYGLASTPNYAGWAEAGQKQQGQQNITAVRGEPMVALRTELPKPMLAGTPAPLPNVVVVQKDALELNERLRETRDAPVAGLKADTDSHRWYARRDEAKKVEDVRKNVDELQRAPAATAAASATPAPDMQPDSGRDITRPTGAVVTSGGVLNFNGGVAAGYFDVNGPGAARGEESLSKAKETRAGLRQEQLAADKSGVVGFEFRAAEGVNASTASAAKPVAGQAVRGLDANSWAVEDTVMPTTPASRPTGWGFANKEQELQLASQIKSPVIMKGIAKGYGGRFGKGGVRLADSEADISSQDEEKVTRELGAHDARKKDLAALGDISKMTGKDTDSDGTVVAKAGDRLELGRLVKRERALEEGEKTRRVTATTTEGLEKAAPATPSEPMPTKPVFRAAGVNPWMAVSDQSFSTFSISVDSASFTLARRYLNGGQRPPPESVRTEEFVNYFDYAYAPPGRDLFSVHAQAARTPFSPPGVQLLKLGIKGKQMGRENRGANLTFLLDTSGSMNAPDRLDLARAALKLLVAKLGPADRVALITFSSRARLVLDFTPATEQKKILAALDGIQAAGFTHLEGGLKLAYQTAARGFVSGAANRVILMSDGVANVGAAATAELLAQVEQYRKQNIFCSVFGLGTGTYDDTMLQALASKGNGTYLFMDSLDEARRVFVDELAATLNKIAADVKIQVEFNPRRVKQYRQLGYEQRQLKTEDFRNDAVAAAEVGSGQSVTALYQVELQGDANEPLGTVRVRGRNLETGRVEELERAITAADLAPSFERADVRFRLAAAAAEFAEILRGSPYVEGASCADVAKVLRPVALELSLDQKVQELLRLVTAAGGAPQAAE